MDVGFSPELSGLLRAGQLTELVIRCTKNLVQLEQRFGERHVAVASAIEQLGRALYETCDFLGSATQGERALRIERELFGESSPHCVRCLSNLGLDYIRLGHDSEAEQVLSRALAICNRWPIDERGPIVFVMSNIALLHFNRQELDRAAALWIDTLRCVTHEFGFYHPECGKVFVHLAHVYHRQGRLLAAERSVAKGVRILRFWNSDCSPGFASALRLLGKLREARGDREAAESHVKAALHLMRKIRPEGHPMITMLEHDLAQLLE